MIKKFSEILKIINGKNQKKVENPKGKFEIIGSGGRIGFADEYLCPAETVVIGRKGSINKPRFCIKPIWNVDTAFGLVADDQQILPLYLYYFCEFYDFDKLNTTVTIPSLTKSNLLNVKIDLPNITVQRFRVTVLELITKTSIQFNELNTYLDNLVKSREVVDNILPVILRLRRKLSNENFS